MELNDPVVQTKPNQAEKGSGQVKLKSNLRKGPAQMYDFFDP